MPMIFKKFLLSFLASLVLLFSFAPYLNVNAADPAPGGTWYNQDYFTWFGKVYDPGSESEIFGERYTAAQVQWVIYGLFAFIMNSTGNAQILSCVLSNTADLSNCADAIAGAVGGRESGRTDERSSIQNQSLLSMVFADRPISGIGYVKEKVNNFKLVPEVQAQTVGFGFSALSPIQGMWRGTRNVAFGLFVLASIIFAFMIMFRVKINPQTVITVQSAIPKVIMALVLVTFSYAIAGFLIDLMYVVIGLLSVILSSFQPEIFGGDGLGPAGVFNFLVYGQPLGTVQTTIFGFLTILILPLWLGMVILTIIGVFVAGAASMGLLFWVPFVILIIVTIMIMWFAIKTVWALFKAFANVVLLTIFAPLQIALGVLIPNFGFGQWVKNYISHLSVFVVTGAIGFLSLIFTIQGIWLGLQNTTGGETIAGSILSAVGVVINSPILGAVPTSPWPPLLGSGDGIWIGIMFLGVAFVLFTMIPKATEVVQAFLSGKPFAYGSAIGEAFGPVKLGAGIYGGYAASQLAGGNLPKGWSNIPIVGKWFDNRTVHERQQMAQGINTVLKGR